MSIPSRKNRVNARKLDGGGAEPQVFFSALTFVPNFSPTAKNKQYKHNHVKSLSLGLLQLFCDTTYLLLCFFAIIRASIFRNLYCGWPVLPNETIKGKLSVVNYQISTVMCATVLKSIHLILKSVREITWPL